MPKGHSVFISYSSKEADRAYAVRDILEENGIRCWMAPDSIPGGSDYAAEIPGAIAACKAIVLIYSANAQNSQYVLSELKQAHDHHKVIVPYEIEACELSDSFNAYLSDAERINAYTDAANSMQNLVDTTLRAIRQVGRKRRRRAIILTAAAVVLAIAAAVGIMLYQYYSQIVYGTTGTCQWSYNPHNKELKIYGEGQMADYTDDIKQLPWFEYSIDARTLTIDSGVSYIGEYAFTACISVDDVVMADSVTTIGDYAFMGMDFERLKLSSNLEHIGEYAFMNNNHITSLELPDSLLTIGTAGFSFWNELGEITIPDGVLSMGNSTFFFDKSLKKVTLPSSLKEIPALCFSTCDALEEINFSEGIETIGTMAFNNCPSLEELNLPQSLDTIEEQAFRSCTKLGDLTIPANVSSIGSLAFSDNAMKNVYILGADTYLAAGCVGYDKQVNAVEGFVIHANENNATAKKYAKELGFEYQEIDS